jgi:hypothetical protein
MRERTSGNVRRLQSRAILREWGLSHTEPHAKLQRDMGGCRPQKRMAVKPK